MIADVLAPEEYAERGPIFKLSPSDFAFLWEECPRCFYLKVRFGFQRPNLPFPKVFTIIHSRMKEAFTGMQLENLSDGMPAGIIELGEKFVQSRPIWFEQLGGSVFIRGRIDTLIRLAEGGFGVADFKTAERKCQHIPLYARQLHAYKLALESPACGHFKADPISKLGLIVFEPERFHTLAARDASLAGHLRWIEIEPDDEAFMGYLAEVLGVLLKDKPPLASPMCEWCAHRDASRRTGL